MNAILKFIRFVRNTLVGFMLTIALLALAVFLLAFALIEKIPSKTQFHSLTTTVVKVFVLQVEEKT